MNLLPCVLYACLACSVAAGGLRGTSTTDSEAQESPFEPQRADPDARPEVAAAEMEPLSARFEKYKTLLAWAAAEHDRADVAEAAAAPADLGTAFGAARLSVHATGDADDEDADIEDEFLGWSYNAHETEAGVIGAPEEVARLKNLFATANAKDDAFGHHAGDGFFDRARDDDYGGDGKTALDFGGELDDDANLDDKDIDDDDDDANLDDQDIDDPWSVFADKDWDNYWSDYNYGADADPADDVDDFEYEAQDDFYDDAYDAYDFDYAYDDEA